MRFAKILALSAALLIGFAAGAITAGHRHWFQPVATIHIRNVSGEHVSTLVVTSKTGNSATTSQLGALQDGAEITHHMFVAGEGAYQIKATLASGRALEGGAGYVESGYTNTELLHADKIEGRAAIW